MNKGYNLDEKFNPHVEDKPADWIEDFLKTKIEKKDNSKEIETLNKVKNIYKL